MCRLLPSAVSTKIRIHLQSVGFTPAGKELLLSWCFPKFSVVPVSPRLVLLTATIYDTMQFDLNSHIKAKATHLSLRSFKEHVSEGGVFTRDVLSHSEGAEWRRALTVLSMNW